MAASPSKAGLAAQGKGEGFAFANAAARYVLDPAHAFLALLAYVGTQLDAEGTRACVLARESLRD
jgi:hypothetical protein